MTGLNLETFLRLVRADVGPWISFGAIVLLLALMAWTSWGRRRALRKCLVLSIVAHFALLLYGGPHAARLLVSSNSKKTEDSTERIRDISIVQEGIDGPEDGARQTRRGRLSDWDRPGPLLASADLQQRPDHEQAPDADALDRAEPEALPEPVKETQAPPAELPKPSETAEPVKSTQPEPPSETPTELARTLPEEEANPVAEPTKPAQVPTLAMPDVVADRPRSRPVPSAERIQSSASVDPVPTNVQAPTPGPEMAALPVGEAPERSRTASVPTPEIATGAVLALNDIPNVQPIGIDPRPSPRLAMPDSPGPGRSPRASRPLAMPDLPRPRRTVVPEPPALVHASAGGGPSLPAMAAASGRRPLPEIPEVYRSRLAPNRSEIARRAGASNASEAAVERALEWLARHQDADGRWNGGTQKAPGGDGRTPLRGETSFLAHCPPGQPCSGECHYWEADTAMTGLALLSFLGAGHTHKDGPYVRTVTMGLNFLLRSQKADGDLRGDSRNVGMYCHAIASLSLCEAYALTGDERLKPSVQRAVDFLVKARTSDGLTWRYTPHDANSGDTSILGWAIMVLKSARETGIEVPPDVRDGALIWLNRVAKGDHGGLAVYRPQPKEGYPITPTMTAEAWVCRQFLGVGGPGPASDEAAAYLMVHGPDRDRFNLYYWYYGTLSMYQHGGPSWTRWNARVRDQLVRRQVSGGHADGSWDPADCRDRYDKLGGRIYTTALAALTLEVYYRYLRLYDAPPYETPTDVGVRRTSIDPLLDLPRPELPDSR